jgi:hypothetical protein
MTSLPRLTTLTCLAAMLLPSPGHADLSPALDRVSIWLGGCAADCDAKRDVQDRAHQQREEGIRQGFTADGVCDDVNGAIAHDSTFEVGNSSCRFWFGEGHSVFGLGAGAQYHANGSEVTARAAASSTGRLAWRTFQHRISALAPNTASHASGTSAMKETPWLA